MSSDAGEGGAAGLPPDEAFAALGNETRIDVLRVLGEAGEPLSFSELRDRIGMDDSGQFNYHLDRLVGHFVRRTDDGSSGSSDGRSAGGYELRRAGERVVESILSGAVTETPTMGPTRVDQKCQYCGAPVEVRYREEEVTLFCTACPGIYGEQAEPEDRGLIGTLFLPPAGVEGRTATELVHAAHVWGGLAMLAAAAGVCPVCSAAVERSVRICEDHERADGVCEVCDERYAVGVQVRCTNCIYDRAGAFGAALLGNVELLRFLAVHGINPVDQSSRSIVGAAMDYEEKVVSTEPFEARFTFTAGGDTITLTVDDDLSVVEVSEDSTSGDD